MSHMHILSYCLIHHPRTDKPLNPFGIIISQTYVLILNSMSFTIKLDREGGAPIDINIETVDIYGFRANRFGGKSKFMAPCTYYSAFSLPTPAKAGNAGDQSKVRHCSTHLSIFRVFFYSISILYIHLLFRRIHQICHSGGDSLFFTVFQLVQGRADWYSLSREILLFRLRRLFRDGCFICRKISS